MIDASRGAGGIRGGRGREAHSSYHLTAPDRTRPCWRCDKPGYSADSVTNIIPLKRGDYKLCFSRLH
jgi:hypothetical protein